MSEQDNLTMEKLQEAISLLSSIPHKETPIRFEVSCEANRILKSTTQLYQPPSPNSTLGVYAGIPVFVKPELLDTTIIFAYPDRKEIRLLKGNST